MLLVAVSVIACGLICIGIGLGMVAWAYKLCATVPEDE